MPPVTLSLSIGQLVLAEENPRHPPVKSQDEVIEALCKDEQILGIARSIASAGLNPIESIGVVKVPGTGARSSSASYIVGEGNRRICAAKLLQDPDLAPAKIRKEFERLAKKAKLVQKVEAKVFSSFKELKPWIDLIHLGAQEGAGRRQWNAEQKQRASGAGRHAVAQAVLDQAENLDLLDADSRAKKLSTVSRFTSNPLFRDALGFSISDDGSVTTDRPIEDQKILIKEFVADLAARRVNSRQNKNEIESYAKRLVQLEGLTGSRIEPKIVKKGVLGTADESESNISGDSDGEGTKDPPSRKIRMDPEFQKALEDLQNEKLLSLYRSICTVSVLEHTPLVSVGVWSIVETVATAAGCSEGTSFTSFFSKNKVAEMLGSKSGGFRSINTALSRILDFGNSTKHHEHAASFNAPQLKNDVTTVTPLLTAALRKAIK